ncbi:hypothetical protein, partial [Phyllobacterium salinisoli]|uniref:hypothetical protein n=1 Tax=Phyllobacterium salinisoli TaxID=1899321 RepID=UPI001AEC77BF
AWLEIEDWQESEIEKDESRDGVIGRFAENAIRLATLRALSEEPIVELRIPALTVRVQFVVRRAA